MFFGEPGAVSPKALSLTFSEIAERRKPSGFVEVFCISPDGSRRSAT